MKDRMTESARPLAGDHPHRELLERFEAVRATTRSLTEPLTPEDCTVQSMPDASPVKWHLAHTTWFFETFILDAAKPGRKPFHPAFRVLFNSYYHAVGDRHPRPQRGMLSRPTLQEVLDYRSAIEVELGECLEAGLLTPAQLALVELGLQHEQQHEELILTDMKHMLSCNPLRPAYQRHWPLTPVHPREMQWHRFEGGVHEI